MKKICLFFLFLTLISFNIGFVNPFAMDTNVNTSIKVYDYADLFSSSDETLLSKKANEIADRQNMDFAIVTTYDVEGKSSMAYADDFFDHNGFGFGSMKSGMLLLINMEYREVWISTTGEAIDLFNDRDIEHLLDVMENDLKIGDYFNAASGFLSAADEHITNERLKNLPFKERYTKGQLAGFSALIGLVVSTLAVLIMYFLHRLSLSPSPSASVYTNGKGILLFKKIDNFITTHTTRTAIPKDTGGSGGGGTSIHTSSSGSSHGGGGRGF